MPNTSAKSVLKIRQAKKNVKGLAKIIGSYLLWIGAFFYVYQTPDKI